MLSAQHLNFSYPKKSVLHDLNFALPSHGLVGIFGHNGCGKSTLLKILSGILPLQKGDIHFDGCSIFDGHKKLRKDIRQISGVLLQESSSDDKLSVLDNMRFFARLMGLSAKDIGDRVNDMIFIAQLAEHQHLSLKKLSGGTKRRCELYRSFLHRPRLLILDEPTAGLDYKECARFFAFAREYVDKEKALLLFSSHQSEDFSLCDQALLLHDGRMIAHESPQSLLSKHHGSRLKVELEDDLAEQWLLKAGLLFRESSKFGGNNRQLVARLASSDLEHCLDRSLFTSPAVKSFSIRATDLSDVYEDLVAFRQKSL